MRRGGRYTHRDMFEPPPPPRRRWFWPTVVLVVAGFLAASVAWGGPWYLIVLAVALAWGFFAIRFLVSERGKSILFSRFDQRSRHDPRGS